MRITPDIDKAVQVGRTVLHINLEKKEEGVIMFGGTQHHLLDQELLTEEEEKKVEVQHPAKLKT